MQSQLHSTASRGARSSTHRCWHPQTCRSFRIRAALEPTRLEQEQIAASPSEPLPTPTKSSAALQPREVHYVDSGRPGYFTVAGTLRLQGVDPRLVWQVLTAYEDCAKVFKNIESSQVHAKEGNIEVQQRAAWTFLAFSGSFDCRLAVAEDAVERRLTFSLIKSSFMRDFEGRWHVSEELAGQDRVCVVEHMLSVKPAVPIPPPFAYYTRPIFVKQVDGVLQDLEKEVVRQQTLPAAEFN